MADDTSLADAGAAASGADPKHPAMSSQTETVVEEVERSGVLEPLFPGSFCGYTHRPEELRREVLSAGLEVTDLVSVEGASFLLHDLADRMTDARAWSIVLAAGRAHERVPELMGIGSHLPVTARRS